MKHFRQLADATPASRDRYMDFLRVFSIVAVVLGHWFMAVPSFDGQKISAGNALSSTNGLWILTWFLQVMPLFFIVGGFANATTLLGKGQGYVEFVSTRFKRLIRPVAVLLAVWLGVVSLLTLAGGSEAVLRPLSTWVTQPLWFVAIYLLIIAIAPPMLALHRRLGIVVPVALVALSVLVDVLRFHFGVNGIGYVNFVLVWALAQQLGFFYADGSLLGVAKRTYALIAGAGLSTLIGLVVLIGYPGSMVGQAGDRFSNMSPPTVAIVALTFWQLGVALLLRDAISGWLQSRRVWSYVIAGNYFSMTLYLWHITAMIVAVVLLYPVGLMQFDPGTSIWFATRPLWFALLLIPLAPLVLTFVKFDQHRPTHSDLRGGASRRSILMAAGGVTLVSLSVLGLALVGLYGAGTLGTGREVGPYTLTPTLVLAVAALGAFMVDRASSSKAMQ